MPRRLILSLTDELRRYVELRSGHSDLYATPSEFICDLIHQDMEDWSIVLDVAQGLREVAKGELVSQSILDVLDET
jgi:antitoxin ParD1/3/4